MKEYEIRVIETSSKILTVTASNEEMAIKIAKARYYDDEIILDYSDFDGVDFEPMINF